MWLNETVKQKIIDRFETWELVDALGISVEEIVDAFEDKILEEYEDKLSEYLDDNITEEEEDYDS